MVSRAYVSFGVSDLNNTVTVAGGVNSSVLKISVVTPVLNSERLIDETLDSVLTQFGRGTHFNVELIVVDGASSDGTVGCVKAHKDPELSLVSEPDTGMYHALAKGLSRVSGDVVMYLNAGDLLLPNALKTIAAVVEQGEVRWGTGLIATYSAAGTLDSLTIPPRFKKRFIENGMYGRELPFIPQEGTFWVKELNEKIDLEKLAKFKLAGDFFIWTRLAEFSNLEVLCAGIAGFRRHQGQLSENMLGYRLEMKQASKRRSPMDYIYLPFEKALWLAPNRFKSMASKKTYVFDTQSWVRRENC